MSFQYALKRIERLAHRTQRHLGLHLPPGDLGYLFQDQPEGRAIEVVDLAAFDQT